MQRGVDAAHIQQHLFSVLCFLLGLAHIIGFICGCDRLGWCYRRPYKLILAHTYVQRFYQGAVISTYPVFCRSSVPNKHALVVPQCRRFDGCNSMQLDFYNRTVLPCHFFLCVQEVRDPHPRELRYQTTTSGARSLPALLTAEKDG